MSKHLPPKENKHLKEQEPKRPRRIQEDSYTAAKIHPDFGFTKRNIIETALALALYIGACFTHFDGWIKLAVFAVPFVAAAYTVLLRAIEEVSLGDFFDDSILILISSIAAFAIMQFNVGAAIMALYRVSKLLEAAAVNTSSKMYDAMNMRLPQSIRVEVGGNIEEMLPQEAEVGEIFAVDPGEMIALDGVVVEGMSALDTYALTGEEESIAVSVGDKICAGCVNVSAPLRVRVEEIFADSYITRTSDALNSAQKYKSEHEKLLGRFERIYTPVLTAAALLVALLPPIFNGEWRLWIGRGIILLILANTAALSVLTSLGYLGAVAVSARNGITIKGTRFVEALYRAKTVVLNKTGTITEGKYTVIDVAARGMTDYDLLCIAAVAEQNSKHPIAKAIRAASGGFNSGSREKIKTETIPGRGISSVVRGKHIYVGNAALLEEHSIHCDVPRRAGTAIHVALNDKYCGYIVLTDKVRDGAFDALEELRVLGVRETVMLTADVRSVARPVASSLNFEMVKPELMPEAKISAVEYLLATKPERTSLAYVCDKASDADVLERADVGVALAALGCDEALDCADVLLLADNIKALPTAVRICKQASEAALQNSVFFLAERLILIVLALSGLVPILPAAIIDLVCSALMFANTYRNIIKKY